MPKTAVSPDDLFYQKQFEMQKNLRAIAQKNTVIYQDPTRAGAAGGYPATPSTGTQGAQSDASMAGAQNVVMVIGQLPNNLDGSFTGAGTQIGHMQQPGRPLYGIQIFNDAGDIVFEVNQTLGVAQLPVYTTGSDISISSIATSYPEIDIYSEGLAAALYLSGYGSQGFVRLQGGGYIGTFTEDPAATITLSGGAQSSSASSSMVLQADKIDLIYWYGIMPGEKSSGINIHSSSPEPVPDAKHDVGAQHGLGTFPPGNYQVGVWTAEGDPSGIIENGTYFALEGATHFCLSEDGNIYTTTNTGATWSEFTGSQGPQGAQGPQGPTGAANYIYNQASPSALWTIVHDLGSYPAVTVVDSAGNVVIGDVEYISDNEITVGFAGGFSGVAYLV